MLERYEGKLSRTVLRRGGASNRILLSLHQRAKMLPRSKISSRRTLQVGDNLIRGRSELRMQELAVRWVGRFIGRGEKRKK